MWRWLLNICIYVALVSGMGEQWERGNASPGQREHTPIFSRDSRLGTAIIYIYIYIERERERERDSKTYMFLICNITFIK
jgi:hypothetical protein